MTIALVRQAIWEFLRKPDPQVLCIRGKWGVGKTYIWNEVREKTMKDNGIALPYYSYVSLFGLQSIDEVRQAIFENSFPTTKGEIRPSIDSFRDNIARLGREATKQMSRVVKYARLPGIDKYVTNFAGGFRQIVSLAVNKTIICFDDFERKKIGTKDLLGLISQLRDQKECKAVIILNEDALIDSEREEFNRYFEKVVEIPITFCPTSAECVAISIKETDFVHQNIRENVVKLNISNIRIIYRIKSMALDLIKIIEHFPDEVKRQALHTLTLVVWSKYDNEAIPMRNILDRQGLMQRVVGGHTPSEDDKKWDRKLREYEFTNLDEFDAAIKLGVESGFFDEAEIVKQADQQNARHDAAKAKEVLLLAWRSFHDTFETDNVREIIETLCSAHVSSMKYVTRGNLDDVLGILRKLGFDGKASELIASYISVHRDHIHSIDEYANPFHPTIGDDEFRAALGAAAVPPLKKSVKEILVGLYDGKMKQEDMEIVYALSADGLYLLFCGLRGDEHYPIIQGSLFFRNVGNATDPQKTLTKNAIEALERIGRGSTINALRVKKFGVEISALAAPNG